MSNTIKTNIRFSQGLGENDARIFGLVTKASGSWRGCSDEDACKKKIVFLDTHIEGKVVPGRLYSCSLIPMKTGNGFIAVSAQPILFKARIYTCAKNGRYSVSVKFGNRVFTYDPGSKWVNQKSIKDIVEHIRQRHDLENPHQVAEDFLDSACIIKRLYENDVH